MKEIIQLYLYIRQNGLWTNSFKASTDELKFYETPAEFLDKDQDFCLDLHDICLLFENFYNGKILITRK